MILVFGAMLKQETRAMVPMTRFTRMKRGEGANQVAIAMKLVLPVIESVILWFRSFLCSVLVGERDERN